MVHVILPSYQCPVAALTNYHEHGEEKQGKPTSLQKPKSGFQQGHIPSEGSRGESVSCFDQLLGGSRPS